MRPEVVIVPAVSTSAGPAAQTSVADRATPRVRAAAQARAVDLNTITATGAGGRITMLDVLNASRARALSQPRAEAPARRNAVSVTSQFDPQRQVTVDVYGSNPVVEDARLLGHAGTGPAPTVFADGELPPFTASGVDPRELRKVPWHARHAVAAAPDARTVLAAIEQFAQDPNDWFGTYRHAGAEDYVNRVKMWLQGRS